MDELLGTEDRGRAPEAAGAAGARGGTGVRYKLTVEYEGTEFCGWQRQVGKGQIAERKSQMANQEGEDEASPGTSDAPPRPAAEPSGSGSPEVELRTVQGELQRAVREVVREPVVVMGASRTDSGVHARGQVAAFTSGLTGERGRGWPEERGTEPLLRAINSRLPGDVLVRSVEVVSPEFNPIGDCTGKGYSYTLWVSRDRPLWERRWVHHVWTRLEVARMQEAAAELVGEHDFAAFAAAGHGRLSTVRRVFQCGVEESRVGMGAAGAGRPTGEQGEPEQRIVIEVSGSGFLWHMVRIIAGTLYEAGRGKLSAADVRGALASGDRRRAGPTLPASGLCLEWVRYE